jgi:beta-barrel assembly-enhancing protease
MSSAPTTSEPGSSSNNLSSVNEANSPGLYTRKPGSSEVKSPEVLRPSRPWAGQFPVKKGEIMGLITLGGRGYGGYGRPGYSGVRRRGRRLTGRAGIGILIALIALAGYFFRTSVNPITGKKERVTISPQQEIALGLQAMPEMMQMHGGEHPDPRAQAELDRIGGALVQQLNTLFPNAKSPYEFDFHLLADPQTVNAFALPGGQVFITAALYQRLETEGQLAGVLGHEIGHVIERHGAERLAEQGLMQGLVGAVGVATYDPQDPSSARYAAMAQAVGALVSMKYGRDDELESDRYGVLLTAKAGYDPRSMVRVMEILAESAKSGRQPEFFSTHPNPENRIGRINAAIQELYPQGVPENLKK